MIEKTRIHPLQHYDLREMQDVKEPLGHHYTVANIAARVADITDTVVTEAIIHAAADSGITDLYLIDKTFIREAIQEKLERDKGCEYCTGAAKSFPTHCDGEAEIAKLTPLPAIDLMTGKMADTADPPFFAIRIQTDDMEEDFVPIRFCPKCGRELKEDPHGK